MPAKELTYIDIQVMYGEGSKNDFYLALSGYLVTHPHSMQHTLHQQCCMLWTGGDRIGPLKCMSQHSHIQIPPADAAVPMECMLYPAEEEVAVPEVSEVRTNFFTYFRVSLC